jgi:parallel beta-helix repeat protein
MRNLGRRPVRATTRRAGVAAAAVASLVAGGAMAMGSVPATAATGAPLHKVRYVSPGGSSGKADSSCATAAFATIQSAVTASHSGDTVHVCAGTYDEQVAIGKSDITLTGAGSSSVIDPLTSAPFAVRDSDSHQPIVPIIEVRPGDKGVTISHLAVDGSGLSSGFSWPGCSDNFAGVLYQAASGSVTRVQVRDVALPVSLFGCQDGTAVLVEAGPTATTNVTKGRGDVTVGWDRITGYDKNGVSCSDKGMNCGIWSNTIIGTVTSLTAQNGVEVGPYSTARVERNHISDNNYTGTDNTTEPQADYAAGIILYGAAGDTRIQSNTLTGNQIGIEVIHSSAGLYSNAIMQTSPGIDGSVGVFTAPCDYYCSALGLHAGDISVRAVGNTISFPGHPVAGTYGIWAGDAAASHTGVVHVYFAGNHITGAETKVVLGMTAEGTVLLP